MEIKLFENSATRNARILKELHKYYMSKTAVKDMLADKGYDGLVQELVKEIGFSQEDSEAIVSHFMA